MKLSDLILSPKKSPLLRRFSSLLEPKTDAELDAMARQS